MLRYPREYVLARPVDREGRSSGHAVIVILQATVMVIEQMTRARGRRVEAVTAIDPAPKICPKQP